jgi:allantoin racemase
MRILLVNPNLTRAITDAMASVARRAAAPGTEIVPVTATFGAAVIASRAENAVAAHAALDLAARHARGCQAVILGVSLDSGLAALRELFAIPAVGILEAGLHVASLLGARIALVTLGLRLVPLYEELVHSYGFAGRVVRIAALHFAPADACAEPDRVRAALAERCRELVAADGAEAIVLAGAALAGLGENVQHEVPVPLVDGVAAAVPLAEGLVRLGLPKPRAGSFSHPGSRATAGLSAELGALFADANPDETEN